MWLGSPVAVAVVRLAATAPIRLLAWELPCAVGSALKRPKKKKKKKKKKKERKETVAVHDYCLSLGLLKMEPGYFSFHCAKLSPFVSLT